MHTHTDGQTYTDRLYIHDTINAGGRSMCVYE